MEADPSETLHLLEEVGRMEHRAPTEDRLQSLEGSRVQDHMPTSRGEILRRGGKAATGDQLQIPPGGVSVFAHGSLAAPAHGTQVTLATFKVPDGWVGVLDHVMCVITNDGGTVVQGSGDFTFSIDIDRPLLAPLATGRFKEVQKAYDILRTYHEAAQRASA